MENNSIIYTFTTEVSELKLNKLTNSYYFNFKYSISDNEYHTVDLTGYNQYQAEGIRKDFIDMISNMSKIAKNLSEQIKNGDILNTSHNIKLEGQKPINNEPFTNIKILSEEQIDYLSKQKGVNNKGVKGESIFFEDDNEKESDSIIRPIGYDEKGNMLFIKHTLQDFQELNKQINKLSEKNKKLKSKNRKLKKQLNKFILKCNGEVVAFDIDKKTGKKSGKGMKLGNINKLTTGE